MLHSKKSVPISVQQKKNPFLSLQNELTKAMSTFDEWFEPFVASKALGPISTALEGMPLMPSIDLVEDKDAFKIEAEMPGMSEDEISVSVNGEFLTISGEKTTSKKDEGKNYIMREISYGNYERSVALPDSVDPDKAKASFKKGMLWIELPKKPEAAKKSHKLKIEKGE